MGVWSSSTRLGDWVPKIILAAAGSCNMIRILLKKINQYDKIWGYKQLCTSGSWQENVTKQQRKRVISFHYCSKIFTDCKSCMPHCVYVFKFHFHACVRILSTALVIVDFLLTIAGFPFPVQTTVSRIAPVGIRVGF